MAPVAMHRVRHERAMDMAAEHCPPTIWTVAENHLLLASSGAGLQRWTTSKPVPLHRKLADATNVKIGLRDDEEGT